MVWNRTSSRSVPAFADLDNQGLIHAEAVAVASSDADASAFAVGHAVYADGAGDGIDDLILDIDNSGTILAEAEADAENEAEATAIGIDVHAFNTQNSDPSIEGTIFNRGFITADATPTAPMLTPMP
jgi:type IV secretory pathway TrbF-like protein